MYPTYPLFSWECGEQHFALYLAGHPISYHTEVSREKRIVDTTKTVFSVCAEFYIFFNEKITATKLPVKIHSRTPKAMILSTKVGD